MISSLGATFSRTSLSNSRRKTRGDGAHSLRRIHAVSVRNDDSNFVNLNVPMSGNLVSIPPHGDPLDCPQCGTAWHLKRGLCVSCLLSCGLDGEMHDGRTFDDELDQVDIGDAD